MAINDRRNAPDAIGGRINCQVSEQSLCVHRYASKVSMSALVIGNDGKHRQMKIL
jgi:hypothetical protein